MLIDGFALSNSYSTLQIFIMKKPVASKSDDLYQPGTGIAEGTR